MVTMPTPAIAADSDPAIPTVETWSDKDQKIVVSQPAAGFLYDLILRAKVQILWRWKSSASFLLPFASLLTIGLT